MSWIKGALASLAARAAVTLILAGTAGVTALCSRLRRGRAPSPLAGRRALLSGTAYNPGWFRAHVLPLAECSSIDEIVLVSEPASFESPKVTYSYPPPGLVRLLGRTLARMVWVLREARRSRPGILIGYHIMPNALICLVAARAFGGAAVYQMTGGPVQIVGGGVGSENVLLARQKTPSRLREALMFHLVRQFDLVVVRGRKAEAFLRERRLARRILIVPGAVEAGTFAPREGEGRKTYDLVSVGRLVPVKRFDRLLELTAEMVKQRAQVRVAIVGDGPLAAELREHARRLQILPNLDFLGQLSRVERVLQDSRAFILTSESEGLSIAMIEAMATGLPAIVPDVGDLGDLVTTGRTGLFIDPSDARASAAAVLRFLDDLAGNGHIGAEARRAVMSHADLLAVAGRWSVELGALLATPSEG